MTHRLHTFALVAMVAAVASFSSCAMTSGNSLAIRGATVIPVVGDPIPNATVLVSGDRIIAVGPTSEIQIPAGARVIDGTGRFLVPGLIEMHGHLSKARASASDRPSKRPASSIRSRTWSWTT
jgi:imidazolonepropionase-like amidohydrolase